MLYKSPIAQHPAVRLELLDVQGQREQRATDLQAYSIHANTAPLHNLLQARGRIAVLSAPGSSHFSDRIIEHKRP